MEFGIQVVRADQAVTLAVAGEVDLSTADELTQAGLQALAEGARAVVVDLTAVPFLDSTGLAALITINNRARQTGSTLVISHPQPRIREVLRITGLERAFTVTD